MTQKLYVIVNKDGKITMDGALYKFKWRDKNNDVAMGDGWTANSYFDLGKDYWEWTNPIIDITPFEEAK